MDDGIYIFISSKVAESLIIHRVEPVLPHGDMVARVSGTVVVVFEISKDGKSGARWLSPGQSCCNRQF